MDAQEHMIKRAVLDFTITDRKRAIPIQNKASELMKASLHPGLEKTFSALSINNKTIRIDKLEVDLGLISEDDLNDVFVEKVLTEISGKIRKLVKDKRQIIIGESEEQDAKGSSQIKIVSNEMDLLERFIYFLRSGYFPWWHKQSDADKVEDIFLEVLKYDPGELKTYILPLFKEDIVRKRLIYQFESTQLKVLIKRIDDTGFESYEELFRVIKQYVADSVSQLARLLNDAYLNTLLLYFSREIKMTCEERRIRFIKDVLESALLKKTVNEKQNILLDIFTNVVSKQKKEQENRPGLIVKAIIEILSKSLPDEMGNLPDLINNIPAGNEQEIVELLERIAKKRHKDPVSDSSDEEQAVDKFTPERPVTETDSHKLEKVYEEDFLSPPKPSPDAEEIYIYNAGLVLIHPFLRYFFGGLNLLDENLHFKSTDDNYKAVHLLQFIVTGEEKSEEHNLVLNKILCGLEVNEAVPKDIPLSDEEKKECQHMIRTVLERWYALKTNKPEALMETYLQRDGILKQAGQGWNLSIERNTFDVMLEKLPWAISIISFPWSKQILYVEW